MLTVANKPSMLRDVNLNVVILNVVIPNVVAPKELHAMSRLLKFGSVSAIFLAVGGGGA
jgi:hypothetical protein